MQLNMLFDNGEVANGPPRSSSQMPPFKLKIRNTKDECDDILILQEN